MSATREICKLCDHPNPIGFRVPDEVWLAIVPECAKHRVVCLSCFTLLGDEKLVEWDRDIDFYPVSLASHLELGSEVP